MPCRTFHDNSGKPVAIVCGPVRRPKCSTLGCRRSAGLECDHPVERPADSEALPKRGDARLHRERKVVFYVWSLVSVEGVDHVTISTHQPGSRCSGVLQTVSVDDWFRKTMATCDRALCERCAVKVGSLDVCPEHAAAAAKVGYMLIRLTPND